MVCEHKFINDLQLEYVDWEPSILIIGTFNPGCGCPNNYAEWFYGRTRRNSFWCILPKVFKQPSLIEKNKASWINFCREHKIAITDIISRVKDVDLNNPLVKEKICKFKDEDLEKLNVEVNDIPAILRKYPSIKTICFTRSSTTNFWDKCFSNTVRHIYSDLKRWKLIRLRSPSKGAFKGVKGDFCEFISNEWTKSGILK